MDVNILKMLLSYQSYFFSSLHQNVIFQKDYISSFASNAEDQTTNFYLDIPIYSENLFRLLKVLF